MPLLHFRLAVIKLAWRDLLAFPLQSMLVVVTLTLAIASIAGVEGFSRIARGALHSDSRQWLAADLSINSKDYLDEQQTAELNRFEVEGTRWTVVTSTLSMAESDQSPDASFIAVKAVDPSAYPFYGHIDLKPPLSLASALSGDSVVVSDDALTRLQVHVGDAIRIGRHAFRIAAVIRAEPDRFAGTQSAGPRCILSRHSYDLSGIARGGNTELHRILLRLPRGTDLAMARHALDPFFPEANLIDFRDSNQEAVWALETAIAFLRVTAFLALVIGAIGVSLVVRQHVERRLDTALVMKILGAQSWQLNQMFVVQILCLTAAAIAIGIPLGWIAQTSILSLVTRIVPLPFRIKFDAAAVITSALAGIMAAFPALLQPLLLLRRATVASVFRRYAEAQPVTPRKFPGSTAICVGAACIALMILAGFTLGNWNSAAFLVSGLTVAVASVFALTDMLLWVVRKVVATQRTFRLSVWGLGIASLYRPANRSRSLIVGMASGLMMMIAALEASTSVREEILNVLPFDRANLFIVGFDETTAHSLPQLLSNQAGVSGPVQMITLAWLRLLRVDGVAIERLRNTGATHGIASKWMLSCLEGERAPAGLALSTEVAQLLHARLGSRIDFAGASHLIPTTVSEIRNVKPSEKIWSSLVLPCHVVEGQNLYHHAAVQVEELHLAAIRRVIQGRYPTLPVISKSDLKVTIESAAGEALLLVRVVAWYAILGGLIVLFAVIAASRSARLRELGILATLGANRLTLIKIYSIEFAAIGLLSGLTGTVLAYLFTNLVLAAVFGHVSLAVDWKPIASIVPVSVTLTVLAGWCATCHLLGRKPAYALREE